MEITLVVAEGKTNKNSVKVALPAVIGRSRDATLTVSHPKISRQHCELSEQEGAVLVRDNGSLNGTFVNGQQVKESLIKPGEKLGVGPLTFLVLYEPATPSPGSSVTLRVNGEEAQQPVPAANEIDSAATPEPPGPQTPAAAQDETPGTVEAPLPAQQLREAGIAAVVNLDDHSSLSSELAGKSISSVLPPAVDGPVRKTDEPQRQLDDPLLDTELATPSVAPSAPATGAKAAGTPPAGQKQPSTKEEPKQKEEPAADEDDALLGFLRDLGR
jgi:pSer/pThr/pTyr-binding forkhead associated (FHA) protein